MLVVEKIPILYGLFAFVQDERWVETDEKSSQDQIEWDRDHNHDC